MFDDVSDLEVPVGFTGRTERLGDLTLSDLERIDSAWDQLIGEGFAEEGWPCEVAIYSVAEVHAFPVSNVLEYVEGMADLADQIDELHPPGQPELLEWYTWDRYAAETRMIARKVRKWMEKDAAVPEGAVKAALMARERAKAERG